MTNAELAILSLIAERPRHGYEIEQVIEERNMRAWTEVGFSSIYYLLKKLERKGLIKGRLEETQRGPARKVYHVMPVGWEALRVAVLEALSVPQTSNSSFLLGLGNLPAASSNEVLAALRQYRDTLAAQLTQMQASWKSQRSLPYFVDALFDYSVTMTETELAWIEKFINEKENALRMGEQS